MAISKTSLGDYGFPVVFTPLESAANTLTFEQLQTGLSITDRIGWVIQRIESTIGASTLTYFNGTGDILNWGICQNNSLSSISIENPQIKFVKKLQRIDFGTAANAVFQDLTIVDDYSNLEGGGILVVPSPIYGFIQGAGLTTAASVNMKIFVKAVTLSDADYFNLVQNTQLLLSN